MKEEIFGPVLTVYVYDDERFEDVLKLCDETSPYSLTDPSSQIKRPILKPQRKRCAIVLEIITSTTSQPVLLLASNHSVVPVAVVPMTKRAVQSI